MVEQEERLDVVFRSLGDPTRRDILKRVSRRSFTVGEIAEHYDMTFAGVAKHVDVLTRAGLVRKTRHGKEQVVAVVPEALAAASDYLETYRRLWEKRLDRLGAHLEKGKAK